MFLVNDQPEGFYKKVLLKIFQIFENFFKFPESLNRVIFRIPLRGCSYGGELARLGGLARLGEISRSLRNSYKNKMCSYKK